MRAAPYGGPPHGGQGVAPSPSACRALRLVTALAAALGACTLAPGPGEGSGGAPVGALPSGFGTLRQEDVSLALTVDGLRLMLTPLDASVTRVTAPDTERRLDGLAATYSPPGGPDGAGLYLVSFFSDEPDVRFEPEDVHLLSRGLRLRPTRIMPVTPSWGERRVRQRQTEMAVYWFDGPVDLETDLALAYGLAQTGAWTSSLARIRAERSRVRSRAGLER